MQAIPPHPQPPIRKATLMAFLIWNIWGFDSDEPQYEIKELGGEELH